MNYEVKKLTISFGWGSAKAPAHRPQPDNGGNGCIGNHSVCISLGPKPLLWAVISILDESNNSIKGGVRLSIDIAYQMVRCGASVNYVQYESDGTFIH